MFRAARKLTLPAIALGFLIFAIIHVVKAQQPASKSKPPVEPPHTPFANTVAGAGIVEARTENISIGSHLPGVVTEVLAKVGEKIEKGTPLFRLDDRAMKSNLRVMQANVTAANAKVELARREWIPDPAVSVGAQRYNQASQAVSEITAPDIREIRQAVARTFWRGNRRPKARRVDKVAKRRKNPSSQPPTGE